MRYAAVAAGSGQRVLERWTWRHTALGTIEHYRALLSETADVQARRPGGAGMAPRFRHTRPTTAGTAATATTGTVEV